MNTKQYLDGGRAGDELAPYQIAISPDGQALWLINTETNITIDIMDDSDEARRYMRAERNRMNTNTGLTRLGI